MFFVKSITPVAIQSLEEVTEVFYTQNIIQIVLSSQQ